MDQYAYNSDLDELSMDEEEASRGGGVLRKRKKNTGSSNDDSKFKSKNLTAERKRRAKLNDRLLQLRALVPIITNMTKANIIKDAITYIEELRRRVEELSEELLELDEIHHGNDDNMMKPVRDDEKLNTASQDMNNWGIESEVKLIPLDDNKLWMKVVYPNRSGVLTKVVEALNNLGFQFNDTSLTTSRVAAMLTSSLEGTCDGSLDVEETKELLQHITSMI